LESERGGREVADQLQGAALQDEGERTQRRSLGGSRSNFQVLGVGRDMRVRESRVRIAQTPSVVRGVAIAGLLAIGCFGRTLSPPPPDPTPMDRAPYTIGVTDVLKITVWKNPELSVDAVPVRSDGMISVPLINDVQAEGLTPEELKDVITRELTEY